MILWKRRLETALSPLGVTTWLFTFGLLVTLFSEQSRVGYWLLTAGAVLFLAWLYSPLADIGLRFLENQYAPLVQPPLCAVDRIVILAGYGKTQPSSAVMSTVSPQTLCNLAEGLRLYRRLPTAKVLLSGGIMRQGDPPIASLMADVLREMGVPAHNILVEGQSQNTYENFVYVQRMIGTQPFILVAAAGDLPRAMAVAHRLGLHPVAAPAGIRTSQQPAAGRRVARMLAVFTTPDFERLPRLQWAFHEYVGYVWYKIRGRL
jgi:uncharacterized SAM-binding protein YcdF (DUF218 family)